MIVIAGSECEIGYSSHVRSAGLDELQSLDFPSISFSTSSMMRNSLLFASFMARVI